MPQGSSSSSALRHDAANELLDLRVRAQLAFPFDLKAIAASIAPLPQQFHITQLKTVLGTVTAREKAEMTRKFDAAVSSMLTLRLRPRIAYVGRSVIAAIFSELTSQQALDFYLKSYNIVHPSSSFFKLWHVLTAAGGDVLLTDWANKFCWLITGVMLDRMGLTNCGMRMVESEARNWDGNSAHYLLDFYTALEAPSGEPPSSSEIDRHKVAAEEQYRRYCAVMDL